MIQLNDADSKRESKQMAEVKAKQIQPKRQRNRTMGYSARSQEPCNRGGTAQPFRWERCIDKLLRQAKTKELGKSDSFFDPPQAELPHRRMGKIRTSLKQESNDEPRRVHLRNELYEFARFG
jgi:hypothetical protein